MIYNMASCGLSLPFLSLQLKTTKKKNLTVVNANSQGACRRPKQKGCKPWLTYSSQKRGALQAVVVPIVAPSDSSSSEAAESRKQLAESYGFHQIGEPLPDSVTLRDIITSLPKKVFEIDDVKAWRSVFVSVTSYVLGIYMIAKAPWYLLPLAWAWTGTAKAGFFLIGHDCAHKSFSKNKLVEDIVGTLAFLPLIYPYEPWRFEHEQHHANTNMDVVSTTMPTLIQLHLRGDVEIVLLLVGRLFKDTAWQPIWKPYINDSPLLRKALMYALGPMRPLMSIDHWLIWHFDLKNFKKQQVKRCIISLAAVYAFIGMGWPLIVFKTGFGGWLKFWFVPWLGYHFWLSTFTMVHHTAPHIPYKPANKWNAAQAQLNGTVHCDYPRWVEVLCHDINVHIPHHVTPKIPSYNLRDAQQSLDENWGKYLNKAKWNWRLMKTIMTTCHIYDKQENYVSFERCYPKESQPIAFLRRVMPDQS